VRRWSSSLVMMAICQCFSISARAWASDNIHNEPREGDARGTVFAPSFCVRSQPSGAGDKKYFAAVNFVGVDADDHCERSDG
jgi:hypothetical protein